MTKNKTSTTSTRAWIAGVIANLGLSMLVLVTDFDLSTLGVYAVKGLAVICILFTLAVVESRIVNK